MITALRLVLGVVVAHPAMALGITLVQETWFGGVGYHESSVAELAMAGLFTFLCAVLAGAIAALVAGRGGRVAALIMSALIVAETIWLIMTGRADGPVWFDVLAASSLIVGILGGAEVTMRLHGRHPAGAELASRPTR